MNNVIIYKGATPGYKEHDTVMLQAHMDMVCEKTRMLILTLKPML